MTETPPRSALRELQPIDPDQGLAIVRLTKRVLRTGGAAPPLVEIEEMVAETTLVVIDRNRTLRQISFLHLIEVGPARHLLALDPGDDFRTCEIAINDILDEVLPCEETVVGIGRAIP